MGATKFYLNDEFDQWRFQDATQVSVNGKSVKVLNLDFLKQHTGAVCISYGDGLERTFLNYDGLYNGYGWLPNYFVFQKCTCCNLVTKRCFKELKHFRSQDAWKRFTEENLGKDLECDNCAGRGKLQAYKVPIEENNHFNFCFGEQGNIQRKRDKKNDTAIQLLYG